MSDRPDSQAGALTAGDRVGVGPDRAAPAAWRARKTDARFTLSAP